MIGPHDAGSMSLCSDNQSPSINIVTFVVKQASVNKQTICYFPEDEKRMHRLDTFKNSSSNRPSCTNLRHIFDTCKLYFEINVQYCKSIFSVKKNGINAAWDAGW